MADGYEHIVFSRAMDGPRRRRANPSPPPDRGPRSEFAPIVRGALESAVARREGLPTPVPDVPPHLVVRVPLRKDASLDDVGGKIERTGLTLVGVEPDNALVAFNDNVELEGLLRDVARFEDGPSVNRRTGEPAKSTTADYLLYVEPEGIEPWLREDRVGARLAEIAGVAASDLEPDSIYVVDVDLWYLGADGQKRSIAEVEACLGSGGVAEPGEITDLFQDATSTVLRVAGTGQVVSSLLDLDAVAEVELPVRAEFDVSDAVLAEAGQFDAPPAPTALSPAVCVLDTGVAEGHPLLASNLGDAQSFLSSGVVSDDQGHGTFVAGIAVFGNVRAAFETRSFESPVVLYSGKLLNADGTFDDRSLAASQIRDAVEYFTTQYGCRVFNLSIGSKAPALQDGRDRVSMLAEALDAIAREFKVLFVLPSGNHELAAGLPSAAEPEDQYPGFMLAPGAGLSDPGTSAISLTVGGLAEYDQPQATGAVVPVARRGEPSPIARTGPGYRRAIKPEFAHYSGNLVVQSTHAGDQVTLNPATSVMSFSGNPLTELFCFQVGTSHAAPQLARLSAMIFDELTDYVGRSPDPNLVRALLAASADWPDESRNLLAGLPDDACTRVLGYGMPDEAAALGSAADRVTLIAQAQIPVDGYHIYEIPIPDSFRRARGVRTIDIAVAHDPVTRRRHRYYLGSEMDFILVRGKTLAEVADSVRHTDDGEEMVRALGSPWRVPLTPSGNPRNGSCARQASTLQKASKRWSRRDARDYGDAYHLVLRCKRRWMDRGAPQDYGLAVVLQSQDARLHAQVREAIQQRVRARVRPRAGT